jgi:hypothetical protein
MSRSAAVGVFMGLIISQTVLAVRRGVAKSSTARDPLTAEVDVIL